VGAAAPGVVVDAQAEAGKGEAFVATLKVGSQSDPNKVAGALAGTIREQGKAEMQTIGAGALNQAVKSIAIARGFLAPSGIDLVCYPAFVDVDIDGAERTAIRLFVEPR
jgi:stage V sporulation protein S